MKRVGYFAPLPPAPTGVAAYAHALLGAVRKHGRVEVNDRRADVALYQVGNNQLHRDIYRRAIDRPGVVVLHDAVLQHFFLGMVDERAYVEEFVYNYGEWTRGLAEDLWRSRARSASDPQYFKYPMLKQIATMSRAIIVHNPLAARAVQRHAPDARVIQIPHLFVPPELPHLVDMLRFRSELGLRPRTMLVGVFGHLRESKRLPVILRAIHRVWKNGADARLLVAGAFASSDLERAIAGLLNDARIIRVGHQSERDFWMYAAATDVVVNLRFPSAGETSGIAIRMMGIGKPVIFTAGEEPANACVRADAAATEEEQLVAALMLVSCEREAAAEIGRKAALHIAREHAIARVAELYWDVLR